MKFIDKPGDQRIETLASRTSILYNLQVWFVTSRCAQGAILCVRPGTGDKGWFPFGTLVREVQTALVSMKLESLEPGTSFMFKQGDSWQLGLKLVEGAYSKGELVEPKRVYPIDLTAEIK